MRTYQNQVSIKDLKSHVGNYVWLVSASKFYEGSLYHEWWEIPKLYRAKLVKVGKTNVTVDMESPYVVTCDLDIEVFTAHEGIYTCGFTDDREARNYYLAWLRELAIDLDSQLYEVRQQIQRENQLVC